MLAPKKAAETILEQRDRDVLYPAHEAQAIIQQCVDDAVNAKLEEAAAMFDTVAESVEPRTSGSCFSLAKAFATIHRDVAKQIRGMKVQNG